MKKNLGKRQNREQKTLYLYDKICNCGCACAGCASTPSSDYVNVRTSHGTSFSVSTYYNILP